MLWDCQALWKVRILLLLPQIFQQTWPRYSYNNSRSCSFPIYFIRRGKKNAPHLSSCLICQLFFLYVTDPQENLNLGNYLFCSVLFWHLIITKVFVHLSFPEEKALNAACMIIGFAGTRLWHYSFGKFPVQGYADYAFQYPWACTTLIFYKISCWLREDHCKHSEWKKLTFLSFPNIF